MLVLWILIMFVTAQINPALFIKTRYTRILNKQSMTKSCETNKQLFWFFLQAGILPYSDGGARPNGTLYGNGRGLSVDQVWKFCSTISFLQIQITPMTWKTVLVKLIFYIRSVLITSLFNVRFENMAKIWPTWILLILL